MAAIGYASLPISVDLRGIQKSIRAQVQAPMEAASKKAGQGIAEGFKAGVDSAGAEVKRLEALEKKAAETVVAQQKKVSDAKAEVAAKVKLVEAAEKSLEAARAGGDAKVRAAEDALAKLRASGKASVEQLEQAELKLKQVRASVDASIASKEASVERARLNSSKAADKLSDSEKKLGENQKFATGVSSDLISATKRLDSEQGKLAKSLADQDTAWGRLSRAVRGWGRDADRAGGDIEGISRKFGGLKTRMAHEGEEAGKSFGRAMSDGVGKSTHNLRNSIAFGAIAGGVAAVTAGAIGSLRGLAREALSASDATDKFKSTLTFAGLDTKKIDELTKSAREYADRTVYELSDIQSVTAQLAANNVKGYDKLAEAGGNLNAIAGGNAETFKSVGLVLTQVNGAGKLVTQDWNQIANAIPGASGKIQEALLKAGAFTGNFRDAMAKGQITAEEFNAAILEIGSDPIAVEAAQSTATFEGMVGNLQANIRGGLADALNALKPEIGKLFDGLSNFASVAMPKVVDAIKSGVEWFGKIKQAITPALADGIKTAAEWFGKLKQGIKDNFDVILPLTAAVGAGVAVWATWTGAIKLWTTAIKIATKAKSIFNKVMSASKFMVAGIAIAAVVAGLYVFFTKTETGRKIWKKFVDVVKKGWEAIKEGFSAGVEWIKGKWEAFTGGIEKVKDAFVGLKDLFVHGDFTGALWNAFGIEEDAPIVDKILSIRETFINVFTTVRDFAVLWWGQIKANFQAAFDTVKTIFETGWNLIKDIFATAWLVIVDIFTGNWSRIPETIANGWNAIKGHFSDGMEKIKQIIIEWGEGLRDRVSSAWGAVQDLFAAGFEIVKAKVIEWVANMARSFEDMKTQAGEKIHALTESAKRKFVEMKDNIIATVKELPDKIKGFFAKSGDWLVDAGKNIIGGLLRGLKQKFEDVKNWLSDAGNAISGVFNGITGSAERQINVHHRHSGGQIPGYKAGGVLPDIPGVSRSVRDPIVGVTRRGVPIARVEPGEFIVNREATARNLPLLRAINGGKLGPDDGDLGLPRFANGGLVSADELLRFFKGESIRGQKGPFSIEGARYVWGGGLTSNWGDCSGAQSGGASLVAGVPVAGRKFSTMSQGAWASSHGFKRGMGGPNTFSMGLFNGGPYGGHTSGTITFGDGKAVNIEMGGRRGNGQIAGAAAPANHPQYTEIWHHPLTGSLNANEVKSTSASGITTTSGKEISWGAASALASEWEKNSSRESALSRWRDRAFDSGGVANGIGFLPKATIKPERVLSPGQTLAFERLPDALTQVAESMGVSAESMQLVSSNLGAFAEGFSLKDAFSFSEKLGLGGATGLFKGVFGGYESMQDAFAAQVDAADAMRQAESNLREARENHMKAMADGTGLTVKQQRRLEDAMRSLEKAKTPDKKGKVDQGRVDDAQRKLDRVREDIAAEQSKSGSKDAKASLDPLNQLVKAESDLEKARGVVTLAAKAAGRAEVAIAIEVAVAVTKLVDKIVGAVFQARAHVHNAVSSMLGSVREFSSMVEKQREQVMELRIAFATSQIQVAAASRNLRIVQLDGMRSQLESAKTVAQAQAKYEAQLRADARARLLLQSDMGLAFDRFRWKLGDDAAKVLTDFEKMSDESRALYAEVQAALIGQQIAEKQARVAALNAVFDQTKAVFDLRDATRALGVASQKLAVMTGAAFGMDTTQATVGERYARLASEKSKIQADQASISNWLNPAKWGTWYPAAQRRISQIDEEMKAIAELPEFKQFDPKAVSEINKAMASAGVLGFFGGGDRIEELIRFSPLGDAARALDRAKFDTGLIDLKAERDALGSKIERGKAEALHKLDLAPLETLIKSLESRQGSEKTWAEYWREKDAETRKSIADVAKFQSDSADTLRQLSEEARTQRESLSRVVRGDSAKTVVNVTLDSSDPRNDPALRLLRELDARVDGLEVKVNDKKPEIDGLRWAELRSR